MSTYAQIALKDMWIVNLKALWKVSPSEVQFVYANWNDGSYPCVTNKVALIFHNWKLICPSDFFLEDKYAKEKHAYEFYCLDKGNWLISFQFA